MSRRPIPTPGAAPNTTSTRAGEDWRARAACLDEDPETFFPIGSHGPAHLRQVEEAKAVCRRCLVMDTCLQWALDTGQDHGILGGLTEDERRDLKQDEQPPAPAEDEPAKPPTRRKPPAAAAGKANPTTRPTCGTYTGYEAHTRTGERQCDTCRAWRARGKRPAAA